MSIREELLKKLELDPTRFTPDQIKNAIESGIIPGYVGFPLIDEIVRAEQQAKMQQAAQQLQQSQNPPVVQQILARANQLQGIDNLQSNLPAQGYAPGGIVAFDGGGSVTQAQIDAAKQRVMQYGTRQRLADPAGYSSAVSEYERLMRAAGKMPPLNIPDITPELPPSAAEEAAASRPFFGTRPVAPAGTRTAAPAPAAPPAATPAPYSTFAGSPTQVLGDINRIEDPKYRAEALEAYQQQLAAGKGRSAEDAATAAGITMGPRGETPGASGVDFSALIPKQPELTPEQRQRAAEARRQELQTMEDAQSAYNQLMNADSPEAQQLRDARVQEFTKQREAALAPLTKEVQDAIEAGKERLAGRSREAQGIALLQAAKGFFQPGKSFFGAAAEAGGAFGESYGKFLESKAKEEQSLRDMKLAYTKMQVEAKRGDMDAARQYENQLRDDERNIAKNRMDGIVALGNLAGKNTDRLIKEIMAESRSLTAANAQLIKLQDILLRDAYKRMEFERKGQTGLPAEVVRKVFDKYEEFLGNPKNHPLLRRVPKELQDKLTKYKPDTDTYRQALVELGTYAEALRDEELKSLRAIAAKQ